VQEGKVTTRPEKERWKGNNLGTYPGNNKLTRQACDTSRRAIMVQAGLCGAVSEVKSRGQKACACVP
jgi:hypothetical protein